MVRSTTRDDTTDDENDLTRFHRVTADARRDFERDFDDVTATFTPGTDSFGTDPYDGGEYVGDDPVYVEVRLVRSVPVERADATVAAMVEAACDRDDFAVSDVDRSGYFIAPVDTSDGVAKPAGGARDATHERITVTARRRID